MLSGIYYGAMYGGSTTSILVNIPGETASVVSCFDGYQMALQGRAGPALGIAAFGSFIAGTLALLGLIFVAAPLTRIAVGFGPPEYFSLMITGLIILVYLTQKSLIKAISMGAVGLILSFVGTDLISGQIRYTFGMDQLLEGVGTIPIVIGLFGIAEVFSNLERTTEINLYQTHIKGLLPSAKDWALCFWPIVRGSVIGFVLGILPGGGAVLAAFISYAVEKRLSKHPDKFGKGAIEGLAAPESSNNAASTSAFIPLMTLGIPSNGVMAILFAGLLIHNVTPGPLFMKNNPDIFWGVIASMYVGNAMLLVLNLPLIGIWIQITKIPFQFLFPVIILVSIIGVYSINNSTFDVAMMIILGGVGYVLMKCEYEPAPLILAFVLGPMMEQALRQSLIMSNGSFMIFLVRPISAVCLIVAAVLLIAAVIGFSEKKRLAVLTDKTQ
jgi:putative tricarboxylic transport membrane protein